MIPTVLADKRVKIVFRSAGRNTWSGVVRYQRCKDYLSPYLDQGGVMVTGLNLDEEREFEKLFRMEEGNLSKYSHYWNDYSFVMRDKERELNLNVAEDALAYKFLLAIKQVANSWNEISDWPEATYVITDDVATATNKNMLNDIKIKASELFGKLSLDQMGKLLRLYPGYTTSSSVAPDVVKARLYEEMEKDPEKFIELVEDKALETKLMINQLVSLKVLRKNRNAYYYGADILGHDLDDTVDHIDNPENQGLKIALKQEITKADKKK